MRFFKKPIFTLKIYDLGNAYSAKAKMNANIMDMMIAIAKMRQMANEYEDELKKQTDKIHDNVSNMMRELSKVMEGKANPKPEPEARK